MILVRNRKGQALVEFVLILPIILLIIFTSIDIGNLILVKNDLNNTLNDEIKLLEKKSITLKELKKDLKDYKLEIKEEDKLINIKITKKVSWISPITKMVLPNYDITSKRVIPNE